MQHLPKVKEKLECTLDELEASAEKEKRARTAMEKERKMNGLSLYCQCCVFTENERGVYKLPSQRKKSISHKLGSQRRGEAAAENHVSQEEM